MIRLSFVPLIIIVVLFSSCHKDHHTAFSCDGFESALESQNDAQLRMQLYTITTDIGPLPSFDEQQALDDKVKMLIQRLNDTQCDVLIDSNFIAVKTNPPMVELVATSNRTGHTFHLDFRIEEGKPFNLVAVH